YASFRTLDVQQPEGIDDVASAAIRLYPNPATTSVTIEGVEGNATVTIVDMNGREVYSAGSAQFAAHSTIDLTGLAQGAYFVRIATEQTTAIRKLIVR
ncbi:MAG: T9SS type A sorting domain-containing protein, partial [Bacteroidales bacterium]|nr:T9SS type A sorting domain-containing protein [Bacteroidales bacterium]